MQTQERRAEETVAALPSRKTRKKSPWRFVKRGFIGILIICLAGAATIGIAYWQSLWPASINMSSTCSQMKSMQHMEGMDMAGMCHDQQVTTMASLHGPDTAEHVSTFTLVAQMRQMPLGQGEAVNTFTINGTSPGPELRVHQGDLVVVHLVNRLPVATAIHWHGIRVPNAEDGVAGLTQDAVPPGQSYTYHFVVKDAGTYWYHAHQHSYEQTEQGLYGPLVVEPTQTQVHDDVDATISLHEWTFGDFRNFRYVHMVNGSAKPFAISARPGQWVRLRIVNTSSLVKLIAPIGVPYKVFALDGHDLNGPSSLYSTPLPIGTGERFDIRFQMPANGPVTLFRASSDTKFTFEKRPAIIIGQGDATQAKPPAGNVKWFDFAHYGLPSETFITDQSHIDATYTMTLNGHYGFMNGRFGPMHTIDNQAFPNTPTIMVEPNQIIKLRMVNETNEYHPMHLHGHTFTVLRRNGHALTGSPIVIDTILIQPHESYDVAFFTDNPGLWMLHCHNLFHSYMGMDMMVVYPNISTPYNVGKASGNFPD